MTISEHPDSLKYKLLYWTAKAGCYFYEGLGIWAMINAVEETTDLRRLFAGAGIYVLGRVWNEDVSKLNERNIRLKESKLAQKSEPKAFNYDYGQEGGPHIPSSLTDKTQAK